ncbi:MAG: hypothetical protein V1774_03870 [Candidatus Eisenbacteria bacterium]
MGIHNGYKRDDVFICRDQSHGRFGYRVSAYHVLEEKCCYPDGCVRFIWKCKLLGKGGRCPKGYGHVGSNCTQCRHYDEEKIHRRPEVLISDEQYARFREDCREFDEWMAAIADRPMEIGGEISAVCPHLIKRVDGPRSSLRLQGFLLRLCPAFVGLQGLEDPIYLSIGRHVQQRLRLCPGDRLEAEGWVRLDRGRLIGHHPRRFHVDERAGGVPLGWDQALLDRVGAVPLPDQPERCLRCDRGVLVDIEGVNAAGPRPTRPHGRRRELVCLEGIARPLDCPFEALKALMDSEQAGGPAR